MRAWIKPRACRELPPHGALSSRASCRSCSSHSTARTSMSIVTSSSMKSGFPSVFPKTRARRSDASWFVLEHARAIWAVSSSSSGSSGTSTRRCGWSRLTTSSRRAAGDSGSSRAARATSRGADSTRGMTCARQFARRRVRPMPVLEHQRRRQLGGQAQERTAEPPRRGAVSSRRRRRKRYAFVQRQAAGIAGLAFQAVEAIPEPRQETVPYTRLELRPASLSVSPSSIWLRTRILMKGSSSRRACCMSRCFSRRSIARCASALRASATSRDLTRHPPRR